MASTGWIVAERESAYLHTAHDDLPPLALAEDVSRVLAEVVQRVQLDAKEEGDSAEEARLNALWFMAIIAFRALRASIQVISVGYEDQAVGYQRLIDELHNRAGKVRGDRSGEYARQWLKGRSLDKGAKLAGQDIWELMSGPVHANARAVFDWLAISQDDGSTQVVIGPERRPEMSCAALTHVAGECRDIASRLSLEAGLKLDLTQIDSQIREAQTTYIPEASGGEVGSDT